MSGVPVIPFDPFINDGIGLSNWLNTFIRAFISTNEAATAPTANLVTGYPWIQIDGLDIKFYLYDGAVFRLVFTINSITGLGDFNGTATGGGAVGSLPYFTPLTLAPTDTQIPLSPTLEEVQTFLITTTGTVNLDAADPFSGTKPVEGGEVIILNDPASVGPIMVTESVNVILNGNAIIMPGLSLSLAVTGAGYFEKCRS